MFPSPTKNEKGGIKIENYEKEHEKIEKILSENLQKLPTELPIYSAKVLGLFGLVEENE